MGGKTKIDWCDATWNPVTGCLHGCEYCYARRMTERFGGWCYSYTNNESGCEGDCTDSNGSLHVLDEKTIDACNGGAAPYPFYFDPTFHKYRLDIPSRWQRPRNIFVCSMADLFGKWVPAEWKIEILQACRRAPQHRYLFLTKNPLGYSIWNNKKYPDFNADDAYTDNMWFGVTFTGNERLPGTTFDPNDWRSKLDIGTNFWYLHRMSGCILPQVKHRFLSIEPISCDITEVMNERDPGEKLLDVFIHGDDAPFRIPGIFDWVIVGAETGNRKDRIRPKKVWVDKLAKLCRDNGTPIFMKESLRELMGDDFRQEYPWEEVDDEVEYWRNCAKGC